MQRKLDKDEKLRLQAERYATERAANPTAHIEVIVEDYTYANGDPIVRVVRRGVKGGAKPD
jgi:hypothetical protein